MKKVFIFIIVSLFASTLRSQCYTSIASKGFHNLAIKNDGTLWAWGDNGNGQLGIGSSPDQKIPTQVGTDNNWWKISAGTYYSAALKTDGTLWAWGSNSYGQTGTLTTNVPHQIGTDNDWVTIATGLAFTAAIKADGTLWMWGFNDYGQLGNGTNISSNVPAQVGTDNNWVAISLGAQQIIALKSNGTMWSWGSDSEGALGLGSLGTQWQPTQIGTANDWVKICAGYSSGAAIKANGTLWTWGYNQYGMVGDGTTTTRQAPVQVGTDTDWNSVMITTHTMAIKNNGTLWAWGRNNFGKIGNGVVSVGQFTPVQIGIDNDWIKFLPGFEHSLALKGNGTLWAWGHNNEGQLGDNTFVDKVVPSQSGSVCSQPLCIMSAPVLANFNAQCNVLLSDLTVPSISDSCGNVITATLQNGTFPITNQGSNMITWRFANSSGTVTAQQNIVIDDVTAPTPNTMTLSPITSQCEISMITPPTATDNCTGTITATTTDALSYNTQGTFLITWSYNDGNGNTSTQTQSIIIEDTTSPLPDNANLPALTAQCEISNIVPPTATDNCAGIITATTTNPLSYSNQGSFTINWSYNDGNGNVTIQMQTVIIEDTALPIPNITNLPVLTGQCGISNIVPPIATDNCTGTVIATTNDPLNYETQGNFVINWVYDDGNGNVSNQQQLVSIIDDINPIMVAQNIELDLNGNSSVPAYPDQIDNGSTDNCGIDFLSIDVQEFTATGVYTITLTGTDIAGNSSSANATVTVIDSSLKISDYIGERKINVYPIPVSDVLNISMSNDLTLLSSTLYDAIGRRVYYRNDNTRKIDVSHFPPAIYYLVIITDKGTLKKTITVN